MAESLSQNAWKPTPISKTVILSKKITSPIRVSQSTSSLIFFIISFGLLSISLLFLSSEHSIFWFVLSNSIIFLIAAADTNLSNLNYYDEYLAYNNISRTTNPSDTFSTLVSSDSASHYSEGSEDIEEKSEAFHDREKTSSLKIRRSKAEKDVGCEKILSRSKTENGKRCMLDAGDLSTMSDEELNRRIEEFIRRFNREILLQKMSESEDKET